MRTSNINLYVYTWTHLYIEEINQYTSSQVTSKKVNFRGHQGLNGAMKLTQHWFYWCLQNPNVRFALQPLGQCGWNESKTCEISQQKNVSPWNGSWDWGGAAPALAGSIPRGWRLFASVVKSFFRIVLEAVQSNCHRHAKVVLFHLRTFKAAALFQHIGDTL